MDGRGRETCVEDPELVQVFDGLQSYFKKDKRKYAHVTACYGLNQDPKDREKRLGIMRINEIVIREGDFSNAHEVTILQNLKRGRPFLSSFW